jgi:multisubunit Na+/H+ antiporter MnhG subunit
VYLIKSGQVELNKKNALVSGAIIVGVAIFMLVLNVIFDTAFFGLSLNGKHSIYNVVLVESSYLSAVLYFLGLFGVLSMGYIYSRLIARKKIKSGL